MRLVFPGGKAEEFPGPVRVREALEKVYPTEEIKDVLGVRIGDQLLDSQTLIEAPGELKLVRLKEDTEDTGGYAKEVSEDTHKRELELIGTRMAKADIVITTALIPGRPAPKLITREMVDRMAKGSVIVDLAATNGGNCEATVPGKDVDANGVTVLGPLSLLSDMAGDASRMYSKNIMEFLLNLAPEGELKLDLEDQIINETLVTRDGQVHHEPTRLIAGSEVQK